MYFSPHVNGPYTFIIIKNKNYIYNAINPYQSQSFLGCLQVSLTIPRKTRNHHSIGWFKGQITGNSHDLHGKIGWVSGVDFPKKSTHFSPTKKSQNHPHPYNVGPPVDSVQLVQIRPISLWFMVLITI